MDPARADAVEKRTRKKLEEDTYKVRSKEGRPKHGTTSMASIGIAVMAFFFQILSLLLPHWRSNRIGVLGYPYPRHWGIFVVAGKTTQTHSAAASFACSAYAQLNVGGLCSTPHCVWYRTKCEVYIDFFIYSYVCGGMLVLETLLMVACAVWTFRMTPRHLRWASAFYFVIVFLHIPAIVVWVVITEEQFETLNTKSFYPVPGLSYAFVVSCMAGILMIVNTVLGALLKKWWPEVSIDDLEDESDTDEGDNKFLQAAAPAASSSQAPRAPPAPGGHGAHPGYGAQAPQVYDISGDPYAAGAQGYGGFPGPPGGMMPPPPGPPGHLGAPPTTGRGNSLFSSAMPPLQPS